MVSEKLYNSREYTALVRLLDLTADIGVKTNGDSQAAARETQNLYPKLSAHSDHEVCTFPDVYSLLYNISGLLAFVQFLRLKGWVYPTKKAS